MRNIVVLLGGHVDIADKLQCLHVVQQDDVQEAMNYAASLVDGIKHRLANQNTITVSVDQL